MAQCSICCENYNKSLRAPIICCHDSCQFKACKTCIRQYLLSTSKDAHCMNCNQAWSQKFIITNANRSFYDNSFKKHKKQLLLEQELSKMPETMEAAQNYLIEKEERKKIEEISKEIKAVKQTLKTLNEEQRKHYRKINELNRDPQSNEAKRKFIMACPNNECRGYLSTQYKCEMCKLYTCPECLEIIGHTKADPHICNQDSIKSAELIKKDTKPCPTCGIRIYKISGCDQMWCTECRVAFSWNTGRIDKGSIHNPHYYKYLQQTNNGEAPRNPNDVLCGGLIPYYVLRQRILRKLISSPTSKATSQLISDLHRCVNHITNNELPIARQKVRDLENNQKIRILYLNKEKSKEELADQVFRNYNGRKKYVEILHIYELLSVVGIETFNKLNNSEKEKVDYEIEILDGIKYYKNLVLLCNDQLKEIGIIFKHAIIQISPNDFSWKRYYTKNLIPNTNQKETSTNSEASCSYL